MRWWAGRGLGAFRDGERIARVVGRGARRRAALVRLGHERPVPRRRHRRTSCSSLSHRCWRTRGIGDFWQHMLVAEGAFDIAVDPIVVAVGHRGARSRSSTRPAAAGATLDGAPTSPRRQLRLHERRCARRASLAALADAVVRPPMTRWLGRHGRDRYRDVVGEGGRRRRRRQRRRPVAHPARLLRAVAAAVRARRRGRRGTPGRAARSTRSATSHAARRFGRGDGAVADRGRRRRRSGRARPALRRRARPQRPRRPRSPRRASSCSSCAGTRRAPDARGYWMAQAVAQPRADAASRSSRRRSPRPRSRLFDWTQWDDELLARVRRAARADAADRHRRAQPLAEVTGAPGCVLEGGTIDAMGEQLVAGCDDAGDVLVICGTTLIVWACIAEPADVAGPLLDPAHRAGQVPRSAVRATRAACS